MSVFEIYEEEVMNVSKSIEVSIGELHFFISKNEKSDATIEILDELFVQCSDLVKQMEVEGRSQDPATRRLLTDKLVNYKKNLANQRITYERAKEKAQRSSLLGTQSIQDRQKMIDTNEKINKQNDIIANALRTVAETEEVGKEIASELSSNTEKIKSTREKVLIKFILLIIKLNFVIIRPPPFEKILILLIKK